MKQKAELIVTNAKVYTVSEAPGKVAAFAVVGGKFAAVGSAQDILAHFESNQLIDARGKPVYPGFIDAHCHFYGYALGLQQINLTGTKSFAEVLQLLKKQENDNPGEWIVGRGWDQNDWSVKEFPDRRELDIAFPKRPVVLIRIDGHVALANGEALKRAKIEVVNRFQPGEVEIRDGWLTGILSETATDFMRSTVPKPDLATRVSLLKKAQQNCFAVGLTTVADAGLESNEVNLLKSLQEDERLKMRIYAMLSPTSTNINDFVEKGPFRNDHIHVTSIKIYADGSLGSRTSLLKAPYSDQPDKQGILVSSPDSIRSLCRLAYENGYQVNTHAIGDSAVKLVLSIYGEFLKGKNDKRWRIEHCQVVDPADLELFNRYSVVPSIQATHATSDMYWAGERLGPQRVKWAYAYKDLLKQNGWIANGTDFPIENISPLNTFYASVSRKDLKGWPVGGFQPENALTRDEALRSITNWAAKSCFEETLKGSIEVGKLADFVILDNDLMTVPEAEISKVRVLKTFVGGTQVFEAK